MYVNFEVNKEWARQTSKSKAKRIYVSYISWNSFEDGPFLCLATEAKDHEKHKISQELCQGELKNAIKFLEVSR